MSKVPECSTVSPLVESVRWQRILDALLHDADPTVSLTMKPAAVARTRGAIDIVVLDRPSDGTIIVQWSSAISCRYGEQTWRKVVARRSGVCMLTGEHIARGDPVFKPQRGRHGYSNASAMIRTSALEETNSIVF